MQTDQPVQIIDPKASGISGSTHLIAVIFNDELIMKDAAGTRNSDGSAFISNDPSV